ncbi:hypothetical protein [Telluribacter sp. SYSU D00476]|uniref:hypothetical protein n=1 Tax=Telluribacter sp. SYSU D00476 TaxID=2811430 RepID=UPI001FF34947|nr:hypothetical protein [Telluribacter sp. SYSU D00476]
MRTEHLRYNEVLINYQTAPVVPAPYSYYYTMRITPADGAGVHVQFDMKYLDREELDEDEIIGEGFTLNDDFSWQGDLPQVWATELNSILTHSQYVEEAEDNELEEFIEVVLTQQGDAESGSPEDKETWAYFLQELMQAIYEAAGREKQFEMEYLRISNKKETCISLNASFVNKTFSVQLDKQPREQLAWKKLEDVMGTVFKAEFVPDQAYESRPNQDGVYLTTGDGLWYKLGESVLNPTPKSKVLTQIENLFDKLERRVTV